MKIQGAIFDLDGTLLDSMYIWNTIGSDYLLSLGITPAENLNEIFKTMSLYQAACYYQKEYHVGGTAEEIMDSVNHMIQRLYFEVVQPKADILDFLEYLHKNQVKMCIATVTDEYLAAAALQRCGMDAYFSEIYTCAKVGKGKDVPDIYEAALAHLNTPKEKTLVIEDSLYAIRTAKAAGFTVAGVYDASELRQAEVKSLSDYYFTAYEELKDMIQ